MIFSDKTVIETYEKYHIGPITTVNIILIFQTWKLFIAIID